MHVVQYCLTATHLGNQNLVTSRLSSTRGVVVKHVDKRCTKLGTELVPVGIRFAAEFNSKNKTFS